VKRPWSLRDLRWKLAFWTWCPAAWVEEWVDARWRDDQPRPTNMREILLLHVVEEGLPLRFRIVRRLIGDPLAWLSDLIYPDWSEDPRARLDYWKRR
jgi:hypothetical protein